MSLLLLDKPLAKVARAIIRAYSGSLYIPNDTNCFQDSAATTAGAKDAVVGYVRDLIGTNHLTQATAGYKPFLRKGAKNWLLNSGVLATQSVTTRAVAYTLHFTGTGTVTLSGTSTAGPLVGTSASDRVSLTFTPTAGSLTLTVSGTVTNAMLETGSSVSTYVETAGSPASNGEGPWWVDFDGSDDRLEAAAPFQVSDPHFAVGAFMVDSIASNKAWFSVSGADPDARLWGYIGGTTGYLNARWSDNTNTGETIAGSTNLLAQKVVAAITKPSDTKTARINGAQVAIGTTPIGASTMTTMSIGISLVAGGPFSGAIYGIATGLGAITDAELAIVERYIGSLGGIAL